MVKPCPALRHPCYLDVCKAGCKIRREQAHSIFCSHHNVVCHNVMCIQAKGCVGRSNDSIQPDAVQPPRMKLMVASKNVKKCPAAAPPNDLCADKDCLAQNECLDIKYGAIAAPKPPMTIVGSGMTAGSTCPEDNALCQMASCNGGANCFLKRSRVHHHAAPHNVPPCHQGMISIGFINKAEILLGRQAAANNWDEAEHGKLALVIGLLGYPFMNEKNMNANEAAKAIPGMADLILPVKCPPNLVLDWPDFDVMDMKRDWWEALVKIIAKLEGCVLIYCVGGHGRTGTAGSIIAALGGIVPDGKCPVEWLRSVYCDKAVESNKQLDYIQEITGRKVQAAGSKQPVASSWSGGHGYTTIKKKSSGSSAGSAKHKANRTYPGRLSIKKWKQWWRKTDKSGEYKDIETVTRPKDIPDGRTFKIGKRYWSWCSDTHRFLEYKPTKDDSK